MIFFMSFATEDDKNKFEYIYHKYKRLLLHKAYQILNDYSLAEDAVSEAFIRIYKNLHKIEDVDSNKTISFLVVIVKNTSLTMLEKEKKNQAEEPDETIPDRYNLEEDIISQLSAERIYFIMDQLGDELKQIFLLHFSHHLSNREIGTLLHITENNVGVKLYRAKKKLSHLIEQEGYVNESKRNK